MCRNIKTLHNFTPPATDEEIRASALQFVRKLSGFTRPSQANAAAFSRAVDEVTRAAHTLLDALVTVRRRAIARSRPPRHGRGLPFATPARRDRNWPAGLATAPRPGYWSCA